MNGAAGDSEDVINGAAGTADDAINGAGVLCKATRAEPRWDSKKRLEPSRVREVGRRGGTVWDEGHIVSPRGRFGVDGLEFESQGLGRARI